MTHRVFCLTLALALLLGTTPITHAVEETADIVFDLLERVDRRTAAYETQQASVEGQTRLARKEAEAAMARLSQAETDGDEIEAEDARADLVKGIARELAAKQRQVRQAQEVYAGNRRDLEELQRHLQRSSRLGWGQGGEEAFARTLRTTQEFGVGVKSMLVSFADIAQAARDPLLRAKLAAAAGSLQAINRGLEAMRARAHSGRGDLREVAQQVQGYLDSMDSAMAQLAMARRFLDDEETKLRVANRLSTIRLISRRVAGVDLKPQRPTDLFDRFLRDAEEMGARTDALLFPPQEKEEGFDPHEEIGTLFQE